MFPRLLDRLVDYGMRTQACRRAATVERLEFAKIQRATLQRLIQRHAHTRFGREHDFSSIRSVAAYQQRVPLRRFEDFWRDYWAAEYPMSFGATCADAVPFVALSSGTSSGTTKYIPVTRAMLRSNQRAALTALSWFRAAHPEARLFDGRMFLLGGSTDLKPATVVNSASAPWQRRSPLAGDLSGIAAVAAPALARPWMFPPLDLALLDDWDEKLARLVQRSLTERITMIGGVPSWTLALFERLRQATGRSTIAEIWPSLCLVIHGGTRFDPYRRLFTEIIGDPRVKFLETYPASEGFVAAEDPRYGLLRLIPDHELFYEFVPTAELNDAAPTRHTAWQVECGVPYAVVLTTCAGLWSYLLGDVVTFEQRDPPLLRFSGRTSQFLSAFGEHLIGEEIERAITAAADDCGAAVADFHVGPVFPAEGRIAGHHRWLVEFARAPRSLARFTGRLDETLSRLNDDYRAHRAGDLTLGPPELTSIAPGGFSAWMRNRGKLGGQHKLPRIDNSGQLTGELVEFLTSRGYAEHAQLGRSLGDNDSGLAASPPVSGCAR